MYNFPLAFLFEMCHRWNTLVVVFPGAMQCNDSLDCARMNLVGYTCQNSRCVCDPNTDTGLFPCRGKNILLIAVWTSVDTRRCSNLAVQFFVLTEVVTVTQPTDWVSNCFVTDWHDREIYGKMCFTVTKVHRFSLRVTCIFLPPTILACFVLLM